MAKYDYVIGLFEAMPPLERIEEFKKSIEHMKEMPIAYAFIAKQLELKDSEALRSLLRAIVDKALLEIPATMESMLMLANLRGQNGSSGIPIEKVNATMVRILPDTLEVIGEGIKSLTTEEANAIDVAKRILPSDCYTMLDLHNIYMQADEGESCDAT